MNAPKPIAQLTITMFDNGNVNVAGPVVNKILCYGMLEGARDAIRDFRGQPPAQIIPITGTLPCAANGNHRG